MGPTVTDVGAASPSPSPATAPGASDDTAARAAAPATTVEVTVPPTAGVPAPGCVGPGHTAVIDRDRQRAWLCDGSLRSGPEFPVTTAISQPDPGIYQVIERDEVAVSSLDGQMAYLDQFVVFTHGKFRGARIGFHALPRTADGAVLQDPATVGELGRRGESAGCIRARPEDAARIWAWLAIGATVTVLT
jgi:hypothetical protein